MNTGWKTAEWVLEEHVVAIWKNGLRKEFSVKVSKPEIAMQRDNEPAWECWFLLEGLMPPILNPATGLSSFQAMMWALDGCYQLMREELRGARLYLTGGILNDREFPDDGMTLAEFFSRD